MPFFERLTFAFTPFGRAPKSAPWWTRHWLFGVLNLRVLYMPSSYWFKDRYSAGANFAFVLAVGLLSTMAAMAATTWLYLNPTAIPGIDPLFPGVLGLALAFAVLTLTYTRTCWKIRRHHDCDRSGWWVLTGLIPWSLLAVGWHFRERFSTELGWSTLAGAIVLGTFVIESFWWRFARTDPGDPGTNRFGPPPQEMPNPTPAESPGAVPTETGSAS